MTDETEDPDTAADRLEVALERIARLTAAPRTNRPPEVDESAMSPEEIAARLDVLIERLRAALEGKGG
ncbi:MAG: hypothetical protein AB7F35_06020 [Acetobacteraceae bacterium]